MGLTETMTNNRLEIKNKLANHNNLPRGIYYGTIAHAELFWVISVYDVGKATWLLTKKIIMNNNKLNTKTWLL